MSFFLNENLVGIDEINNVDAAFNTLYSILNESIEKFVPKKRTMRSNDPPWYNKALKHLKNIRNKEYKKCKLSANFDSYNMATEKFMQLQRQLFDAYINRIQGELGTNSRYFWKFANNRRKQNGVPSVVEYNGDLANDDSVKAILFAEFFQHKYAQDDAIDLHDILNECDVNAFDFEIEEEVVRKVLESINVNKGRRNRWNFTETVEKLRRRIGKTVNGALSKIVG